MQDKFKFRYFNKLCNKMVEPKNWQNVDGIYECIKQQVCFDEDIAPLPYDHIGNGHVFMQCTGLKDKNGKFIYQEDIVRDTSTQTVYKVSHKKCAFYLENEEYIGYFHELSQCFSISRLEVIGNIYENPNLLKGGEWWQNKLII